MMIMYRNRYSTVFTRISMFSKDLFNKATGYRHPQQNSVSPQTLKEFIGELEPILVSGLVNCSNPAAGDDFHTHKFGMMNDDDE